MRIGTIVQSGCDSRRIGAIGWSIYRMHIGTIIVCVGSSTVPATDGDSRLNIELVYQLVGRSQAYRRDRSVG